MTKFAIFDEAGFPVAFYAEDVHGLRKLPVYGEAPEPTDENPLPELPVIGEKNNPDCLIPAEAIEITDVQWSEFLENLGFRKWEDGEVVPYEPPVVEQVIILPAVTLWERLTENEADQVNEAMATQSVRTQRIFTTANTFRSDHELWPLLEQMATELFGTARAAVLLAP
ncbi:hypothetical protein LQT97_14680 [Brucella pseudogrignonensis]|uniref:hypothetical protein n=1 Tax=Brucella pseudogrignonensis TaxID=419475 RepID=UPI001E55AA3B|nr:hypothetical protein [Brucella pseudogrignonensis]MCD4512469.1 hypothetical protein [Brucella pseudogrignonensis]